MSSQLYRDARAEMVRRRMELQGELVTLDEAIAALDKVLRATGAVRASLEPTAPLVIPQAAAARPPLRELILDIMREVGQPMHGNEIVAVLAERGLTADMKKPVDSVWIAADRLRRAGQLVGLGRNRWALPEVRPGNSGDAIDPRPVDQVDE